MDLNLDEISSHSHAESEHSPLQQENIFEAEAGNLSPTTSIENQFHHEKNLLEEAGNLSPVANPEEETSAMLLDAGDQFIKTEPRTPNFLESEDSFGQPESFDEYSSGEAPLVVDPLSKPFPSDDFNFDKELPSIPSSNEKNGADLLFSSSHFEAPEKEECNHPEETKLMEEDIEHEDLEEEFKEQTEEPVQEASQWKMDEKTPQVLSNKLEESLFMPQPEEVIPPPTHSHRPAPPVPVEEEFIPPTKSVLEEVESLISTSSPPKATQPETTSTILTTTLPQPETSTVQQIEPVTSSETLPINKTRSVRSSKSEMSISNTFFGKYECIFISQINSTQFHLA